MFTKLIKKWWFWSGLPIGCAIGYCLVAQHPINTDWQIVDRDTSIRVLSENSQDLMGVRDGTAIASNITAIEIAPTGAPPLTIYRFNTQRLCGIGGCLHSIYSKNELLFRVLLNRDATISTQANCIEMKQLATKNTAILSYCYEGDKYVQHPVSRIAHPWN